MSNFIFEMDIILIRRTAETTLKSFVFTWGVSGPVVRALDSGSDGPGSSPGWGTTLWP